MKYFNDETGAVTVDWVVLTAALVGLGLATMAVVSPGVQDVSGDIADVGGSRIVSSSFAGMSFNSAMQSPSFEMAGEIADGTTSALVIPQHFALSATVRLDSLTGDGQQTFLDLADGDSPSESRIRLTQKNNGSNQGRIRITNDAGQTTQIDVPDMLVAGETFEFGASIDENGTASVYKNGVLLHQEQVNGFSGDVTLTNAKLNGSHATTQDSSDHVSNFKIATL